MKVFNLQCGAHHVFEGWFGSDDDYASQMACGLLACPLCGDQTLHKLPSAPRLNLGAAAPSRPVEAGEREVVSAVRAQALQAAYLQFAREVVAQTEDVGERFAEEARRIHHGESEERGIRGQASAAQTRELLDEGIAVLPLPLPEGLEGPLQ
jgi:hypothetical protein